MPRFFFHRHDDSYFSDDIGAEFPDFESARAEGIRRARALVGEQAMRGYIDLTHWIEIHDESGQQVAIVGFHDAVAVWALNHDYRN